MFVLRAASLVAHETSSLEVGAHAGNQRSDHPDVACAPATAPSRGRVSDALLEASSQEPQRRAGRADSPVVQTVRGEVRQGETGLADEVARGHFHIVEMDLCETGRAKTHQI